MQCLVPDGQNLDNMGFLKPASEISTKKIPSREITIHEHHAMLCFSFFYFSKHCFQSEMSGFTKLQTYRVVGGCGGRSAFLFRTLRRYIER